MDNSKVVDMISTSVLISKCVRPISKKLIVKNALFWTMLVGLRVCVFVSMDCLEPFAALYSLQCIVLVFNHFTLINKNDIL